MVTLSLHRLYVFGACVRRTRKQLRVMTRAIYLIGFSSILPIRLLPQPLRVQGRSNGNN